MCGGRHASGQEAITNRQPAPLKKAPIRVEASFRTNGSRTRHAPSSETPRRRRIRDRVARRREIGARAERMRMRNSQTHECTSLWRLGAYLTPLRPHQVLVTNYLIGRPAEEKPGTRYPRPLTLTKWTKRIYLRKNEQCTVSQR